MSYQELNELTEEIKKAAKEGKVCEIYDLLFVGKDPTKNAVVHMLGMLCAVYVRLENLEEKHSQLDLRTQGLRKIKGGK